MHVQAPDDPLWQDEDEYVHAKVERSVDGIARLSVDAAPSHPKVPQLIQGSATAHLREDGAQVNHGVEAYQDGAGPVEGVACAKGHKNPNPLDENRIFDQEH